MTAENNITLDLNDFNNSVKIGRLLGIDLGNKTIGLALGSISVGVATPLVTFARTKLQKDLLRLKTLLDEEEISGIVVGYPLEMDGTAGDRCAKTMDFAHRLLKVCELPILLFDERYSTVAVERVLIQAGDLSRKKRGSRVDQHAAAFILQGVLDSHNNPT